MFKVTSRDQGHYKGPSGAFVTYCNISCFFFILSLSFCHMLDLLVFFCYCGCIMKSFNFLPQRYVVFLLLMLVDCKIV